MDGGAERAPPEQLVAHEVAHDELVDRRRRLLAQPDQERRAGLVDDGVRDHRRDDLAAQLVLADLARVLLRELRREVRHQERLEQRQVRDARCEHAIDQVELRVRDQHREQVARQALARREPAPQLLVGRDVLGRAVERVLVEVREQIEERLAVLAGAQRLHREQRALEVVVLHARRAHVRLELAEQLVARLAGHDAGLHERREQDLEVDLVIAAVDAGRVVDRVRVAVPAVERVLGARALRDREVRTLADDLRLEIALTYVPMPPNHIRSTSSVRIARTMSGPATTSAVRPSSVFASRESVISFAARSNTPPPRLIASRL